MRDGLTAKFDGQWLLQGDYSSTQIIGTLNVKDIESELGRLDIASADKRFRYENYIRAQLAWESNQL